MADTRDDALTDAIERIKAVTPNEETWTADDFDGEFPETIKRIDESLRALDGR